MKAKIFTLATLLILSLSVSATVMKDNKKEKAEVTFLVSMTCEKCQKRIEKKLSFEKGVTKLDVNLPRKTVTIEYRKDKTSPDKLKKAIKKLGYTATPVSADKKDKNKDKNKDKKASKNVRPF